MTLTIEDTQLREMLEQAAEKGAARALKTFSRKAKQGDWITKEEALELLECSYRTLLRLVNSGLVQSSGVGRTAQKYYYRPDLVAYKSGCNQ